MSDTTPTLTDEQREAVRRAVCFHPERPTATGHEHRRLVDALAPLIARMVADAERRALREARDALYAGEGPDLVTDSDIVYGEWLGNRADSLAAQPAPEAATVEENATWCACGCGASRPDDCEVEKP